VRGGLSVSQRIGGSDTEGFKDRAIHWIADRLLSVPVATDRTPEPGFARGRSAKPLAGVVPSRYRPGQSRPRGI